ncbi:hypothetical protein MTO96_047579 [Rhipicephalus appendiculatus]
MRGEYHRAARAFDLLRWLIKWHRCIVSLEANYDVLNSATLVETLTHSSSLRRITIIGPAIDPPDSVDQVRSTNDRYRAYTDCMTCTAKIEIPVLLLEKPDATLASLDLTNLQMSPSTAKKLIEALIKNDTVEQLAVGSWVFTSDPAAGGTMERFAHYLAKRDSSLRELTLGVHHLQDGVAESQALARAISAAATLKELTWRDRTPNHNYGPVLVALTQSQSLRSLTFLQGGQSVLRERSASARKC